MHWLEINNCLHFTTPCFYVKHNYISLRNIKESTCSCNQLLLNCQQYSQVGLAPIMNRDGSREGILGHVQPFIQTEPVVGCNMCTRQPKQADHRVQFLTTLSTFINAHTVYLISTAINVSSPVFINCCTLKMCIYHWRILQ